MALRAKIERGEFAVVAEIEPPKGIDVTKMVANAVRVKEKVDAFLVPEMSNAVMRMSSLGGALLLRTKGLDAIMQICCRDRNRLALQADLLAGAAGGIESMMLVSGQEISLGDHPSAKPVNDVDLDELLTAAAAMKNGKDMAGIDLEGAPGPILGTMINSGLSNADLNQEIDMMTRRQENGAGFFVTPPIFDLPSLESFLERLNSGRGQIFATVMLLKSLGMARYIERNVENIFIPPALIKRIQKSSDKTRECIAIATETIALLRDAGVAGVVISTLGWEHRLPEVLGDLWEQKG